MRLKSDDPRSAVPRPQNRGTPARSPADVVKSKELPASRCPGPVSHEVARPDWHLRCFDDGHSHKLAWRTREDSRIVCVGSYEPHLQT